MKAFTPPRVLNWCARNGVDYPVKFIKNSKLLNEVQAPMTHVREHYQQKDEEIVEIYQLRYRARHSTCSRWIISRLEHGPFGGQLTLHHQLTL